MTTFLSSMRKSTDSAVSVPRATPPKVFEIANLFALGTTITGDLELLGGIRIDGVVHGRVLKRGGSDADEVTVHVAETGEVHGEIVADNVIIDGKVTGNVRALKHLLVKGFISGTASYGESVELTGEIEASVTRLGHLPTKVIDQTAQGAEANAKSLNTPGTASPSTVPNRPQDSCRPIDVPPIGQQATDPLGDLDVPRPSQLGARRRTAANARTDRMMPSDDQVGLPN